MTLQLVFLLKRPNSNEQCCFLSINKCKHLENSFVCTHFSHSCLNIYENDFRIDKM